MATRVEKVEKVEGVEGSKWSKRRINRRYQSKLRFGILCSLRLLLFPVLNSVLLPCSSFNIRRRSYVGTSLSETKLQLPRPMCICYK
jgi:hypothetical protein